MKNNIIIRAMAYRKGSPPYLYALLQLAILVLSLVAAPRGQAVTSDLIGWWSWTILLMVWLVGLIAMYVDLKSYLLSNPLRFPDRIFVPVGCLLLSGIALGGFIIMMILPG